MRAEEGCEELAIHVAASTMVRRSKTEQRSRVKLAAPWGLDKSKMRITIRIRAKLGLQKLKGLKDAQSCESLGFKYSFRL